MNDEQYPLEVYARCYRLLSEATGSLISVPLEALAKAEMDQLAHIRSLCLDEMTRLLMPVLRESLRQSRARFEEE